MIGEGDKQLECKGNSPAPCKQPLGVPCVKYLNSDSLLDMLPRNDDVDKKQEQIHDCCGVKRLEELMSMEPKLG